MLDVRDVREREKEREREEREFLGSVSFGISGSHLRGDVKLAVSRIGLDLKAELWSEDTHV